MILEEIFSGAFYPAEVVVPQSPAYKELMRSSNALLEQLKEKLPKEDFALVEQLLEQDLTAHSIECECHFKYGFSAGLILLQEAYQEIRLSPERPA